MSPQDFPRIDTPAGYVPLNAMSFANSDGAAVTVARNDPLPTVVYPIAAPPNDLTGTTMVADIAGPFVPMSGWPIWVTLSGSWHGKVTVLRSTDGGETKTPLTAAGSPWAVFERNVQEIIAVETSASASYYLQVEPTSGAVIFGFAQ